MLLIARRLANCTVHLPIGEGDISGSLFGLPLSQRVDLNGQPSVGWLLYLYQANTSTPVNSYQDTALTVLNPWPIAADAYGMMRQFWLADGSYRARATSADGSLTYFDQPSILALGASSGAAPSGGVDPNAIFQTGDMNWKPMSGTRSGWVRSNGGTIGSGASGASERPNDDTHPLFDFLWNTFPDSICPVVTGRGGSSAIDWGLSKKITLLDMRGLSAIGADAMGASSGGHFPFVPVLTGSIDTPGSTVGGNMTLLVTAELPSHTHAASVTDPGHTHTSNAALNSGGSLAGGGIATPSVTTATINSATTGISVSNANAGSDTPHNNVPRSVIGTWYQKL